MLAFRFKIRGLARPDRARRFLGVPPCAISGRIEPRRIATVALAKLAGSRRRPLVRDHGLRRHAGYLQLRRCS
jgi:hypothetical protein